MEGEDGQKIFQFYYFQVSDRARGLVQFKQMTLTVIPISPTHSLKLEIPGMPSVSTSSLEFSQSTVSWTGRRGERATG